MTNSGLRTFLSVVPDEIFRRGAEGFFSPFSTNGVWSLAFSFALLSEHGGVLWLPPFARDALRALPGSPGFSGGMRAANALRGELDAAEVRWRALDRAAQAVSVLPMSGPDEAAQVLKTLVKDTGLTPNQSLIFVALARRVPLADLPDTNGEHNPNGPRFLTLIARLLASFVPLGPAPDPSNARRALCALQRAPRRLPGPDSWNSGRRALADLDDSLFALARALAGAAPLSPPTPLDQSLFDLDRLRHGKDGTAARGNFARAVQSLIENGHAPAAIFASLENGNRRLAALGLPPVEAETLLPPSSF